MQIIIIYALIFVIALIVFELILRLLFTSSRKSSEVNYRLQKLKNSQDHKQTFGELLLKRGIDTNEPTMLTGDWIMKLYAQSGLILSVKQRYAYSSLWLLVCFAIFYLIVGGASLKLFLFATAMFFGGIIGFLLYKIGRAHV